MIVSEESRSAARKRVYFFCRCLFSWLHFFSLHSHLVALSFLSSAGCRQAFYSYPLVSFQKTGVAVLTENRITRRKYLKYVGGVAAAAVVAGAGYGIYEATKPVVTPVPTQTATLTATLPKGRNFRITCPFDIATLDPTKISTYAIPNPFIYEGLLKYKTGTTDIIPSLATSWEMSSDGREWTFHLNQGVEFHDGTVFNAEAVKVNFDRYMAIGEMAKSFMTDIDGVQVVDEYTAKFILKNYYTTFLPVIASEYGFRIASASAIQAHKTTDDPWAANWLMDHAVGTGPYKLVEWKRGEYVIVEKLENYWRKWKDTPNNIDRISGTWIEDESTRKLALLNKEVDWADDLVYEDAELLGQRPDMITTWGQGLDEVYTFLNKRKDKPLSNKKLREAMTYGLDYEGTKGAVAGHATEAQGPVPRGMFGHNDKLPVYKRDVERAKQCLADAGYAAGELKLSLLWNTYAYKERLVNIVKANMADIGIDIEPQLVTWPVLWEAVQDPDAPYDLYIYDHEAYYADPMIFLKMLFWSEAITPAAGFFNKYYSNPEVDRLIEQADKTPQMEEQRALIEKVQEIVMDDYANLYLLLVQLPKTYWNYVKGWIPDLTSNYLFNIYDMYLE